VRKKNVHSLSNADLFDDLVGAGKDRGRDLDADRARYLEVDHQLKFGRLPDRRVSRRGSFQHLVREVGEGAENLAPGGSIAC
jgi:hypothetical protein